MKQETIEKIYAGLLGMDAGMRLGAPVENPYWTYERLREYYGDMRGYLREYKNYAADDDVNGPVIFVRALGDNPGAGKLTPEMVGETWLNYTRRGRGMFWWGGEDLSTEHRAYMNLKRGARAPRSGSIALNGLTAAEQIGGQIFIDTWGLVCPGRPAQAAELARTAASVSHDGNGLHGAAFMAACVAAAFEAGSLEEVLEAGLEEIPADCDYRRVVDAVRAFHARQPEDFRACRDYVNQEFGPHRFPGYCHIIPNAGICVLAMLYAGGELGRAIEISVMCGFDTDCNASNIGTILGVLHGLGGVPERYRAPIRDSAVLSSVSGYLNMLDFPTFAKELGETACLLRGEALPEGVALPRKGELLFDFELPGSTHGLELSDRASHWLRGTEEVAHSGRRCAEVMIDGKMPPPADLSFHAFYTRADFNDERYEPVFAPRVCPGQAVSCWMMSRQTAPAAITVTPFITLAMSGRRLDLPSRKLPEGEWTQIAFTVPSLDGDLAHRVGWRLEIQPEEKPWTWGKVYVDDVTVTGAMDYALDMSIQRREFGEITPFSCNDCTASLDGDALRLRMPEDPLALGGQAFTGNYYARDGETEAAVTVLSGSGGGLILRGQGTRRYYALGFAGAGKAAICRYLDGERTVLAQTEFPWREGEEHRLLARARGEELSLLVDGQEVLRARDGRLAWGMTGACQPGAGEGLWRNFRIRASC